MAEYIEREYLMQKVSRMIDYCKKDNKVNGLTALFQVGDAIMDCKSEDVEPVRHGMWVQCFEDWRKQIDGDKCSVCGFEHYGSVISHYHYCSNCGAKMDLRGDDNG